MGTAGTAVVHMVVVDIEVVHMAVVDMAFAHMVVVADSSSDHRRVAAVVAVAADIGVDYTVAAVSNQADYTGTGTSAVVDIVETIGLLEYSWPM